MLAMQHQDIVTSPRNTKMRKQSSSSHSPLDTLAAAAVTTNPKGSAVNAHAADHMVNTNHQQSSPTDQSIHGVHSSDAAKDHALMAAVGSSNGYMVKNEQPETPDSAIWNSSAGNPDDAAIDTDLKAFSGPAYADPHIADYAANYMLASGVRGESPHGNAMSLDRLNNPAPGNRRTSPADATHSAMELFSHMVGGHMNGVDGEQTSSMNKTPRKKKPCDICGRYYSNLATHKSIHLSDNSRPHTCQECGRGFARPNDLFRHQKSHRRDTHAPFRCPLFYKPPSLPMVDGQTAGLYDPPCHQNGGFSRCDTYKNHLKAMHFEYPAGTKKRDRHGMDGKCRACKMHFSNADQWIVDHIESGECEGVKRVKNEMNGLI